MTEDAHVVVGQIVGVFGIKGALKVRSLTDFTERFARGARVWIKNEPRVIRECHWHNGQARITVEGIDSIEAAEVLRGQDITIPSSLRPQLEENEYMNRDLVGLRVVDAEVGEIGTITAVHKGAAHDYLEVGGQLIPAVAEFVKDVDLAQGVMRVKLIPGMRPGEEAE
jgi:16S rRNA processing protein RimM